VVVAEVIISDIRPDKLSMTDEALTAHLASIPDNPCFGNYNGYHDYCDYCDDDDDNEVACGRAYRRMVAAQI